jgi:hypothetical protein
MRQSGNALRKLIRSVAAAGFWSGGVNGERQDLTSKPLLPRARQGYWDRLLIDPGWAMVSAKCCHSQLLEIVLSTGNSR